MDRPVSSPLLGPPDLKINAPGGGAPAGVQPSVRTRSRAATDSGELVSSPSVESPRPVSVTRDLRPRAIAGSAGSSGCGRRRSATEPDAGQGSPLPPRALGLRRKGVGPPSGIAASPITGPPAGDGRRFESTREVAWVPSMEAAKKDQVEREKIAALPALPLPSIIGVIQRSLLLSMRGGGSGSGERGGEGGKETAGGGADDMDSPPGSPVGSCASSYAEGQDFSLQSPRIDHEVTEDRGISGVTIGDRLPPRRNAGGGHDSSAASMSLPDEREAVLHLEDLLAAGTDRLGPGGGLQGFPESPPTSAWRPLVAASLTPHLTLRESKRAKKEAVEGCVPSEEVCAEPCSRAVYIVTMGAAASVAQSHAADSVRHSRADDEGETARSASDEAPLEKGQGNAPGTSSSSTNFAPRSSPLREDGGGGSGGSGGSGGGLPKTAASAPAADDGASVRSRASDMSSLMTATRQFASEHAPSRVDVDMSSEAVSALAALGQAHVVRLLRVARVVARHQAGVASDGTLGDARNAALTPAAVELAATAMLQPLGHDDYVPEWQPGGAGQNLL